MKSCFYLEKDDDSAGYFTVEFIVKETGVSLVRHFDSPYLARIFMNKVRRSKKLVLLGTGGFS